MTKAEKETLIGNYLKGCEAVLEWSRIDAKKLDFRPAPDSWTIREHIAHMVDAELNGIPRARKAIAEPGSPVLLWEEELWAKNLPYGSTDVHAAASLFKALREWMASSLRTLIDQDWEAFYYTHPKNGKMTLADFLKHYADHVGFHKEYVDRLLQGK